METDELLSIKQNIFDHILYEFEMYIDTYTLLINLPADDKVQLARNVVLESHCIHLRNLIDFFNCEKNCITTKTIFNETHDLSFDDSRIKAKQAINKSIEHLTEERYTLSHCEENLTRRCSMMIHSMYNEYIVLRIMKCVEMLVNGDDIKGKYMQDLREINIQLRLRELIKKLLFICNDTNCEQT